MSSPSAPRTVDPRPTARAHRLRRSADFARVQGSGRRLRGRFLVLVHAPPAGPVPRFGLAVSRKVGGAVVRNRVKRRIREIVRIRRDVLPRADLVFIALPSAADAGYAALLDEIDGFFRRLAR